jgi:3-dehydroquinate synthase
MERLRVELGERAYEIQIGQGLMDGTGQAVREALPGASPRMAVISNPTVFSLYGERLRASLVAAGFEPAVILVPDGEQYKGLTWMEYIYTELLKHRLDRRSAIVALGGGVVGDMAGYAAATYMRGIPFVQVPTTLLAQVDSSVGGKTGVNHPLGKNMIGAFWQPSLVRIDMDTLATLPRRELLAGMAEVIKYGVIRDRVFFDYLGANAEAILALDRGPLGHIIKRSCEVKAEVVAEDEREGGLRAILNYGHTVGHAVETLTGYTRWLHGETVAMGMYAEARLSVALGHIPAGEAEGVRVLIERYGLQAGLPVREQGALDPRAMLDAMALDKKTVSGTVHFILPTAIGQVLVNEPVEASRILALLEEMHA